MFSCGIAHRLLLEVLPHSSGRLLQLAWMTDGCIFQLLLAARRRTLGDCLLQIGIQALVWIQFRAVTGQIEHLDLILMLGQPRLDFACMVNLQVVQDQEHLAVRALDQSLEEADQKIGVHRPLEYLPAHLALVRHRRNQTQALALVVHPNNKRLPFRCITATANIVGSQSGLVAPMKFDTLVTRSQSRLVRQLSGSS